MASESHAHPIPPSSPPALPPSSPLPTEPPPLTRKRTRDDHVDESSGSSDPAIFSDDGLDRSLEDYADVHRKRKYRVGTWWKNEKPAGKTEIKRNVDSGVWLPSDGSTDSDAPGSTTLQLSPRRQRHAAAPDASKESPGRETYRALAARPLSRGGIDAAGIAAVADPEAYAQRVIIRCLEQGKETVDLMSLGLKELTNAVIQPLHALIKYPHREDEIPSSDDYQSFTPHMQLYLSGNSLRQLPTELWRLENITVLSLRNNKLERLPSSIAKLRNLVELNVSGNRLRWLPWEMISLLGRRGNLSKLTAALNPLIQGVEWQTATRARIMQRKMAVTRSHGLGGELRLLEEEPAVTTDQSDLMWLYMLDKAINGRMLAVRADDLEGGGRYPWKRDPIYVASSATSWILCDGSPSQSSPSPPSSASLKTTFIKGYPAGSSPPPPHGAASDCVPSLTEVALRSLSALSRPQIRSIPSLMPEDTPDSIAAAVNSLVGLEEPCGQKCSVCSVPYVIARAEWLEFWHYVPDAMYCSPEMLFLPFLRRACSWACAAEVGLQSRSG